MVASIPNAEEYNITNPQKNLGRGSGLVFIPGKDQNGTYPPLRTSSKGWPLLLQWHRFQLIKSEMITLGGDAELELVDSLDPFSEGVVFSVRPPKKSWKNIANLSGGEKTLSSLALVFALHHYKPTPLYVMDEIDAALDFKNVSIVGHYVKDRTKDAQFIIISLRNNMFELADRLVGIYKTDNCTKSITINPGSFVVSQKVA
ncbi:hypothetical protein KY284_014854 [Solanum tuberosum]|nr:hypothetical protein KY284_014854 [Solanum tuberosum]